MSAKTRWCFFVILWCFSIPIYSAYFKSFSMSEGLLNNTVKSIAQDKKGYIWVGTLDGLFRFDGLQFKRYNIEQENTSIKQVDVLYADDGGLWIGSTSGLFYYSFDDETFHPCFQKLSSGEERTWNLHVENIVYIDGKYVFFANGELYIQKEGFCFDKIKMDIPSILSMVLYKEKYFLFLTRRGLFLWDIQNESIINRFDFYDNDSNDHGIYYSKNEDAVYKWRGLGFGTEAYKINDELEIQKLDVTLPSDVKTIIDYNGETYFGTDGEGLKCMHNGELLESYTLENSNISSNAVFSLFVDNYQNLWIGTYHGGLNLFSQSFGWFNTLLFEKRQISHRMVTALYADKDQLYIGLDGGGLEVYDRVSGETVVYNTQNSSIGGNNIVTICQDDKYVWMGIYGKGLCRFSPTTKSFKMYETNYNRICEIKDDGDGHIWIVGESVCVFDKASEEISIITDLIGIWACGLYYKDKDFYIGTYGDGIYVVDRDTRKIENHYNDKSEKLLLEDKSIRDVFLDSKQQLWISTETSLYRVDESGKVEKMLQEICIVSMLEDDYGYLWLGTNNGFYRYDSSKNILVNYGKENNIPLVEFNINACYKEGNTLFFGAIGGLTWFDPSVIEINSPANIVYFEYLQLMNEEEEKISLMCEDSKEIRLSHEQNFFKIAFSVPELLFPNKISFTCYLKNLEKTWREVANTREVSYTNVPPGEYFFYVKSSDINSQWSGRASCLHIIISPPWWKTKLALSLWSFLILGGVGLILWLYLHEQQIKHVVQLKEMEKNMTKKISEAKLNFFANITHELRTPIFLITAPLEELLNGGKGAVKVPKSYLISMYRNAMRLNKLISRIIDFRKLESQNLQLNLQKLDVVSYCKNLVIDYENLCSQKDITFYYQPSRTQIFLSFDPEKMETILSNLVSNAFKYTPEGGHVIFSVIDEENSVIFKVEDNGIGIDKDYHQTIFDSFFQVDPFKSSLRGDGIGLSFVKKMVELHGGEVHVESELQKGSVFSFTIPKKKGDEADVKETFVVEKLPETESKETIDIQSPMSSHTILIIDDENETVEILERFLIKDFRILKASNGMDGLEIVREVLPDIIICDIMMPKMDGTEFLSIVKNDKKLAHIPVILFSAKVSEEDKMAAFDLGADAYLTKPISLRYLRNRINHLLAKVDSVNLVNLISNAEKTYTKEEQRFLLKCKELIDDNLMNAKFDISYMANELGMSHSSLYRKIKEITGMTIIEFINEYRLFKAIQYFREGETNISAVCVKCGFNDIKHFRNLFKRKMNMSPKQYVMSL